MLFYSLKIVTRIYGNWTSYFEKLRDFLLYMQINYWIYPSHIKISIALSGVDESCPLNWFLVTNDWNVTSELTGRQSLDLTSVSLSGFTSLKIVLKYLLLKELGVLADQTCKSIGNSLRYTAHSGTVSKKAVKFGKN